jgi:hypothetical protein
MAAQGWEISPVGVAKAFEDIVDIFVIDTRDHEETSALSAFGFEVIVTEIIMSDGAGRRKLGRRLLDVLNSR